MIRTTRVGEWDLSVLQLGTVQFGLSYGIANTTGQPPFREVCRILAAAAEAGVNCLDTAAGYGESEEVLGRALAELGLRDRMVVVTKVRHISAEVVPSAAADRLVEESVVQSLKRLRLDALPICLFHAEANWVLAESLLKLKARGLVRHAGCSVVSPGAARQVAESGLAAAVQIPTSVLDRRFVKGGVFDAARARRVALFVRSIYLQGLLLMPEADILPELAEVIPVRRRLDALAREAGLSLAELAARYVLGLPGFSCAVVGVETEAQMRQNTDLFAKPPLDDALMRAVADAVPDLPEKIVFPALWSKRMPDAKPVKA
jgi:aryl-alcohol dehydrogenase-like predicted oxidoreductase